MYQLGACSVYVIFVAESIKKLVDVSYELDIRYYMLMLLLPLIAINCIRNLKLLVPFTSVANVLTFIGMIIILCYVLEPGEMPSLEDRQLIGEIGDFPLFVVSISIYIIH